MDRVVSQQVGQSLGVRYDVNGYKLEGRVVQACPKNVSSDPSEPVDPDPCSHTTLFSVGDSIFCGVCFTFYLDVKARRKEI